MLQTHFRINEIFTKFCATAEHEDFFPTSHSPEAAH